MPDSIHIQIKPLQETASLCQNGCSQKDKRQEMLARMWRKGPLPPPPPASLVGTLTGAATMVNSTAVPPSVRSRPTTCPSTSGSGYLLKENETLIWKYTWGAWVAQSVKGRTAAQVMTPRVTSSMVLCSLKTDKHLKNCWRKDLCAPMFIAALFTIAWMRKQPSVHGQVNGQRRCGVYTQWNITRP